MPVINSWSRYIASTCGSDLNTTIARKVGVDPVTISRWRTGSHSPKPHQVVDYARAYGQSPISALIAAEYLTDNEAGLPITVQVKTLSDYPSVELARELAARLADEHAGRSTSGLFPTTTALGDGAPHISMD